MAIFRMRKNALARAEKAKPQVVVAQVREIAKLMAQGNWILGVTEHDMCEKWGVDLTAVRRRAAESRRLVQQSFGDLEDLRADVLGQLAGIARETRKTEPRTAVSALLGVAAVTGLVVTHRVNERGVSPDKRLSPTQRREEIARIRAQLDAADADAIAELNAIDVPSESPGTPDE